MVRTAVALVISVTAAIPAGAQLYSQVRFSRPSDSGPSARVGQIGGVTTRFSPVTAFSNTRNFGASNASLGRGLDRREPLSIQNYLPPALLPSQTGVSIPNALVRGRPELVDFTPSIGELRAVSALDSALSYSMPLYGARFPRVDVPYRTFVAPQKPRDAFSSYFGLRSAEPEAAPVGAPAMPLTGDGTTIAQTIDERNAESERQALLRGLAEFRLATTAEGENRELHMAQAVRLLSSAPSRSDPKVLLLLAYAALAQNQTTVAYEWLRLAVARDPGVFIARPNLADSFGDASVLDQTLRDVLRASDENASAALFALQAFAAWELDDKERLRRALLGLREGMKQLDRPETMRPYYYALSATVE